MRYRRFGKTNLNLSVFSLGTMRYLESQENAIQTIQQAVALGINHLETSNRYGKSEQYLGAAFQSGLGIARSQIHITTKITPETNPHHIRRHIDESLNHLGVDYIDCLAIHGLNTWEHLDLVKNHCIPPILEAIADSKIHHVGFSTHGPLEVILAAINTDLFSFVNLHYYYFFQRNAPAIQLAHTKDMGIFIISPADKGGLLYTPPITLKNLCDPLSPLELTYRFLLSDSRITTLSIGAANPQELAQPLSLADKDFPLTPLELEAFERLQTHQNEVLATSKCSQCYECLPCPENINIPEILRLRNLAISYDMNAYGKYRYRMFENAGHWFPGMKGNRCTECGECLPKCPENLDIPALLQDTHQQLKGNDGRRLWQD